MNRVRENSKVIEKMGEADNTYFENILKFAKLRTGSLNELLDLAQLEALKITQSKYGYIQLYDATSKKFKKEYDVQNIKELFNLNRTKIAYDNKVTNNWKEAIDKREPIIHNSILDDLHFYTGNGSFPIPISRLLTLPVIIDNEIMVIVEVCNKNTDYTQQDIKLLNALLEVVLLNAERFELANKLKRANKKADEGERLQTSFMNNISHEIRTPMNAITGFSKLLMNPKLTEEKKKNYISIIINSSNQLLSIVTDILTISSIDSKNESLDLSEVNINQILTETEIIFAKSNINKDLEISLDGKLEYSYSKIITDKTKLTQILTNLINNAIKFTKQGRVTFGCHRKGGELEFYVKDTGIGINQNQFEKIYNRFYQVDMKSNRVYGGTGLGLSICKEFVTMLHGRIWLESEIKNGTTFYFSIPFIPASSKNKSQPKNISPKSGLTILVAEDEKPSFQLIKEQLADVNCKIIHAKNGKHAIEEFHANSDINLILMDIKMPEMEGHIAAQKIKKIRPNVPIIAQTAYALPSEIRKYGSLFDDYMTKPIEEDVLLSLIKKHSKTT